MLCILHFPIAYLRVFKVILFSHYVTSIIWAENGILVSGLQIWGATCISDIKDYSAPDIKDFVDFTITILACGCPPLGGMDVTNDSLILAQLMCYILYLPWQQRWPKKWKKDCVKFKKKKGAILIGLSKLGDICFAFHI